MVSYLLDTGVHVTNNTQDDSVRLSSLKVATGGLSSRGASANAGLPLLIKDVTWYFPCNRGLLVILPTGLALGCSTLPIRLVSLVRGHSDVKAVLNGLITGLWFEVDTGSVDLVHPEKWVVSVAQAQVLEAAKKGAGIAAGIAPTCVVAVLLGTIVARQIGLVEQGSLARDGLILGMATVQVVAGYGPELNLRTKWPLGLLEDQPAHDCCR